MTKTDKPIRSRSMKQTLLSAVKSSVKRIDPRKREALSKIPLAVTLYRGVLSFLVTLPDKTDDLVSDVYGFKMYLDPGDDTGCLSYYLSGNYEPATSALFRQVLSEGDTVVDVGAHWGYYTLLAASVCGNSGHVFAFEPHPANLALLKRSAQANAFSNVTTVPKAVSDCVGECKLFLSRYSVGHSIRPVPSYWKMLADHEQDSLSVGVTSLDAFFSNSPSKPRIVKLDVEGAEPLAFRGMRSLMETNVSLVLIAECNPSYLGAESVTAFVQALADCGCEIAVIDDDQRQIQTGSASALVNQILKRNTILNILATRDEAVVNSLSTLQQKLAKKSVQR